MRYMQIQKNMWLFSPFDTLFGRDIHAFAYQEKASAEDEGYGYESCTSDPFISPERTLEVEEHNIRNPVALIIDPSPMMVDITIMLLSWYRKFPAKDELEEDIKDLVTLGKRLSTS